MIKVELLPAEIRASEGKIIRELIKKKKASDGRFTQAYVASLLEREQTIFPQWLSGKTPIPDIAFIALSEILEFDPFATRPYLKTMLKQLASRDANTPGQAVDSPNEKTVPVLNAAEAKAYITKKRLPIEFKTIPELLPKSSNIAFGFIEESRQYEPAISEGATYYILPMSMMNVKMLHNRMIACWVGEHIVVGRIKPLSLGKISLTLPDNTDIDIPDGVKQIIGLVTQIYNP